MKLLFKQRFFSWLDSYDIFYENGEKAYTVKSELDFGHNLHIYDPAGRDLGSVQQRLFTWLPKFEVYLGDTYMGCIKKEFSFFTPRYNIEGNGWHIEGEWMEWDYEITNESGALVATISKEIWNWTDTYSIDVVNEQDALLALMFVLAIDAEKCSRS